MSRPPSIFMIAGEPSGDVLGARLMAALRDLTGGKVEICGVGGEMMREQGLESLFPMEELSVMGIAEILPHLPRLLRRIRETAAAVDRAAPDALVTIDSPDFTRRVVRRVTDRAIPRIHFVAPTVWAWRPWRAKGFARDFTHLLALLPFEPPWFESVGLPCDFVGHPVIESGADKGDGAAFRARHGIAADAPVVCVLPGSRRGEIVRLAGDFGSAMTLLVKQHSGMRLVVPTVEAMAPMVRDLAAGWPGSPIVLQGAAERYDAMAASNAALAASGTVALELALARVPTVVAYRVAPLTHFIVRRLLSIDFGNLINIIEDREIVPELIQGDCRPDRLAEALERMLGPEGVAQTEAMQPALSQLGLGGEAPSRRAAQAVLDIIARSGT
ncbi:MAG: lipid-A-disaccharide synthase [Alphaproteobacteria bacterium]|nr:lipid-A-disaccharide synthase [Alphaproteobacteria bacterium]MCK5622316.1 lipid-A-disaccharide synthase [Alphaproteobacteria bacterium]